MLGNLPPGISELGPEINPEPGERCERCGREFFPEFDEEICEECALRAIDTGDDE